MVTVCSVDFRLVSLDVTLMFSVQVRPPDTPPCRSPLQVSLHSQGSDGSAPQDDFVMVDFVSTEAPTNLAVCSVVDGRCLRPQRPAFSKDDLMPMDLGTFYREFQNPPQLASLSLNASSQSMADDLVRPSRTFSSSDKKDEHANVCVVLFHRTRCRRSCAPTRRTLTSSTPSWTRSSRTSGPRHRRAVSLPVADRRRRPRVPTREPSWSEFG